MQFARLMIRDSRRTAAPWRRATLDLQSLKRQLKRKNRAESIDPFSGALRTYLYQGL